MSSSDKQTEYILSPRDHSAAPVPPETAWDVLDRFTQRLQHCDQTNDQIRLVLEAVCEGVGADTVYWYSSAANEELQVLGKCSLAPEWCRYLAERLLDESPGVGSRLLMPAVAAVPNLAPQSPASAALVRVSRSRSAWIVALRYDAGRPFQTTDVKVMTLAKRILLNHRQQARVYEKLKETLFGLVGCLTTAIDAKDPFTCGHSERVARLAVRIGQQMHLPGALLSDLYLAGLLHDIGKIGVKDRVLQKAGALTDDERSQVREHSVIGDRIMCTIKQLHHLRGGVRHHHERFDGKGYPDGLSGEQVPLLARILAVADGCDAMLSPRPYRAAMTTERVEAILAEGAGSQWDPEVVKHFLACRNDLYPICRQGVGDSLIFQAVRDAADSGGDDPAGNGT